MLTTIQLTPVLEWRHQVTDSDVLTIWKKIDKHIRRVPTKRAKFKVGQHVRISKEKMKFTKGAEENYSREIFRNNKVIKKYQDLSKSWKI
jgi:hypothetical protein